MARKQTFFDVRLSNGDYKGLYCNAMPLRRPEAETLANAERQAGNEVEIVPTRDKAWERAYGDK